MLPKFMIRTALKKLENINESNSVERQEENVLVGLGAL